MSETRMSGGAKTSAGAQAMDAKVAFGDWPGPGSRPRLGVLDFNPIQYHSPLYQLITRRARVELDVLFLTDDGHRPVVDPGFGVPVSWDIDLLAGYEHQFMTMSGRDPSALSRVARLARWVSDHDAVVVHGYSNPWMLLATLLCRTRRVPYLLRGDSVPQGQAVGLRRQLRNAVARTVASASAAGLAIGQLNEEFYRRYGASRIIWAPYSVDDVRFAGPPPTSRSELLSRWNLDGHKPVILFCGKLSPRKRPLDLCAAAKALTHDVNVLFVGDGVLADEVRACLPPGTGAVTGFVHQSELPAYYHAADIIVLPSEWEPWGLVVNEAMAAGVLPVVSDQVGAAPDLVVGVGEVYPCGNTARLADALGRALALVSNPKTRDRVRQHAAKYCLSRTATGFEEAAFAVSDVYATLRDNRLQKVLNGCESSRVSRFCGLPSTAGFGACVEDESVIDSFFGGAGPGPEGGRQLRLGVAAGAGQVASAALLIERYAARRSIEAAIEDAQQVFGAGQARNRTARAVERTVPFQLACQAIATCWYATTGP